jgi:autotransporter translocation and assembly factor TamB
MLMEMRILVFVSGVETWKVTPSKSEMTWSIEAWVGLLKRSVRMDLRRRLWYSRSSYSRGEMELAQRQWELSVEVAYHGCGI